jgi:cell division septation protein DedD
MAALSQSAAAAPLPPPIPLPTPEPVSIRGTEPMHLAAEPASPSGALLAAPPPERPSPEPIPLFDRRPGSADHLPPRLRNKLGQEDDAEAPPRRSLAVPIAGVLIAALAITAILMVRFGPWALQRRDVEPANAPANAPAPTPAPADTALPSTPYPPFDKMNQPGSEFTTRTAQAGARNVPVTEPAPTTTTNTAPAKPPATSTPAPVAPATARQGSYAIAVGTFMNERRATAEQARLSESTNLATRVQTVREDSLSMYRVVVGSYPDRSAAERAATDLVQRGLVSEARVVSVSQGTRNP